MQRFPVSNRITVWALLRNPEIRIVTIAMLVSAFGSGMYLAGSAIFFTRTVGFTPVAVATGLSIASFVALLTALPLGSLADWVGMQRFVIGLHLVRGVALVAFAFIGDPVTFAIVASVATACQQASFPILQTLIGQATTQQTRVPTLAMVRAIRNVGLGLGALVAAPMIAIDDLWLNRGVLIGTGVGIGLAGVLLVLLRQPEGGAVKAASPFAGLRSIRDLRYLGMAATNGILALHDTMLVLGFPLWIASRSDINDGAASLVLVLNTLVVVCAQVPFSRGVNNGGSARRSLWRGGAALAAACLILAVAEGLSASAAMAALGIAALLFTVGEMWHVAGSWEISWLCAPEDARGSYLAVYALGIPLQEILGPLLFAAVVLPHDELGWIGLAVLFMIAAAATTALSHDKARDVGKPLGGVS